MKCNVGSQIFIRNCPQDEKQNYVATHNRQAKIIDQNVEIS